MMLSFPMFSEPVSFKENKIPVLIIENKKIFRKTLEQLAQQIAGDKDIIVLSENFNILDFSKNTELITDIFNLDFTSKKLLNKLNAYIKTFCPAFENEFCELFKQINNLGNLLTTEIDIDINFSEINDIDTIIKLLNFSINQTNISLCEQIIEYMTLYRSFLGKKLFIIVNLKSFFSEDELKLFYKTVFYNKFNALLLESHQTDTFIDEEQLIIIDEDLCEI